MAILAIQRTWGSAVRTLAQFAHPTIELVILGKIVPFVSSRDVDVAISTETGALIQRFYGHKNIVFQKTGKIRTY
jgi:hypothetical protein